jgi:aryl-alcohol dehydrogenase-like predicted oxidoreductase
MKYRVLGKTGYEVSEIGFGTWALGSDWGTVTEEDAMAAMQAALDAGVNFFDTADVYGDGRSEQLIGKFLKSVHKKVYVATKAGRRLSPHTEAGYTKENLTSFVERSLTNLQVETIDLLQLHCPPTPVYYMPEVFAVLDELVKAGKIRHYGVSVEKVEEGLKAMDYPNLGSVQVIYNMFRQRPSELLFTEALRRDVGIIVRVPLASGLLTGTITKDTHFEDSDHRSYNREGKAFDRGETFAGVDLEIGLKAVEKLKQLVPEGETLSQLALRWILMEEAVSTTIPGGKNKAQVEENVKVTDLPPLTGEQMEKIRAIYNTSIRHLVHQRW